MMFYEMFIFVYVLIAIRFDTFRQQKRSWLITKTFVFITAELVPERHEDVSS